MSVLYRFTKLEMFFKFQTFLIKNLIKKKKEKKKQRKKEKKQKKERKT